MSVIMRMLLWLLDPRCAVLQGPLARQSSGWAHSEHSYGGSIPRQFSSGSVKQLDGMIIGPDKLKVSAAYVAQMAKVGQ